MKFQWKIHVGDYLSSASSSYEDIFVFFELERADATIDPQTVADRYGAELLEE